MAQRFLVLFYSPAQVWVGSTRYSTPAQTWVAPGLRPCVYAPGDTPLLGTSHLAMIRFCRYSLFLTVDSRKGSFSTVYGLSKEPLEQNIDLFVLTLMHFPCRFQIMDTTEFSKKNEDIDCI